MTQHQPRPMQSALSETLQQLSIGRKLRQYEIFERWQSIVGDQIARAAKPEKIDHSKLFIKVTQSTWRNELVFLKIEIMEKINAAMGQEIITDIIFR